MTARYASIRYNVAAVMAEAHALHRADLALVRRTNAAASVVRPAPEPKFAAALKRAWAFAKQDFRAARQGAHEDHSPFLILELSPLAAATKIAMQKAAQAEREAVQTMSYDAAYQVYQATLAAEMARQGFPLTPVAEFRMAAE